MGAGGAAGAHFIGRGVGVAWHGAGDGKVARADSDICALSYEGDDGMDLNGPDGPVR